jgi:iron complex outermembrane receptor protein
MRNVLKRSLLAGIAVAFAPTTAALAQAAEPNAQPDTATLEEVVVTGLRSVSGSRQEIKREAQGIVDSLTSEQIERTPDLSLAESLERIAGVNGVIGFQVSESRTVTVRGFDARYNSFSIDGNPIWNSSRNNRGTQLDVFPTSVVNQVSVFKSVTADLDANSIGGHVGLRTLRAFDGGGRPYLTARSSIGGYDQESLTGDGALDYRVSFAGKRTFADGRWGVVIGAESQRYDYYDQYNQVTGYAQVGGVDVVSGSLFRGLFQHRTQREALYGKVEYGSEGDLYGFLSLNYFRQQDEDDSHRGGVFLSPAQITGAASGTGNFTNAVTEVYLERYDLDRETFLAASGFDFRVGDTGAINVRASYTRYDNDETTYRTERFQFTGLSGSYDISRTDPAVTLVPRAGMNDAANYLYRTNRDGFENQIPHQDDVYSLRADYNGNTQAGAQGFGVSTGLYFRRLDREFNQTQLNYRLPTGTIFRLSTVVDPDAPSQQPTGTGPVIVDPDSLWAFLRANGTFSQNDFQTADYNLVEDVLAGHASVHYNRGRFGAILGVRVEDTSYTNQNSELRNGVIVPVEREFEYTEVLPNAQVRFDLTPDFRLRAAYTETLGRPDFVDFAFGRTVTPDANGNPVISGTNPFLKPRQAESYDLSAEYYLPNGLISLGLFSKELANETFTQRIETRDPAGLIILTETTPLNTGSGSLQGWEANLIVDRLVNLPAPLDGFGFSLNYTLLEGEWNVVFSNGTRRTVGGLRNQPRWIGNASLTYASGPIDATLSYRAQGRTFTGGFGTTEAGDVYADNYDRLDLSASYRLRPGVKLFGEIRNITDTWRVEQTGLGGGDTRLAIAPGRSWSVGIRGTF